MSHSAERAGAGKSNLSKARPKAMAGVEVFARHHDGKPWILRTADGRYFAESDDRELGLWKLLDGSRTIEDLALAV
ncbi:MAG: hypothetical protein HY303_14795, partial [Candidatus Wallbacteria bacterium]|nr:hypothetical protein [Candidatus Wallbacteria bacterium]